MADVNWKRKLAHTKKFDYDDWLEYFRKNFTASHLMSVQADLEQFLPPDGYAALQRWIDIFENPAKIDKLYKARLDAKQEDDLMDLAVGDDDGALYEALIKKNTALITSSGVSPQEVARLSQNIDAFRQRLKEIRARKPKEGTVLAKVLADAAKPRNKPSATKKPKKTTSPEAVRAPKKRKMGTVSSRKGES